MRRAAVSLLVSVLAQAAQADSNHRTRSRWYASEPHVPLVAIGDAIMAPTSATCSAWSTVGARWFGVDAWGQHVGARVLSRRKRNTDSGCFEVEFAAPGARVAAKKDNAVLFVSGDWRPSPSVRWVPSADERVAHARFIATLAPLFGVRDDDAMPPLRDRTMFFRLTDQQGAHELAVSGGKILVVAERDGDGRWIARYVENLFTQFSPREVVTYEPIAVFDMNGDGRPEIVFHQIEQRWFWYGDVVLIHAAGSRWEQKLGMFGTE